MFDARCYWQARHDRFRGDPRAVGRVDRSVAENDADTIRFQAAIASVIPDNGTTVLDVGCGTGRLRDLLTRAGFQYTGLDFAASGPDIINADISEYSDGGYDLIIAAYVMVHIVEDPRWETALHNMVGMLNSEGSIILADNLTGEGVGQEHVRNRPRAVYQTALFDLGLHIESTSHPMLHRISRY